MTTGIFPNSIPESKDSEYIDIKPKGGSVYLPKDTVNHIVDPDNKGSDIHLSLETSTGMTDKTIPGSLSEEMRAKIANATVVNINLTNAKTIQNLGDVNIVTSYTLKEGERSDLMNVYYIGSDGSVEEKSVRYFEEGGAGYVEFTTTHFSHYAIIFDNIVPPTQSYSRSNHLYYVIAAVAILAIGALAIVVTRKSRA